jgi:hypothetical protein
MTKLSLNFHQRLVEQEKVAEAELKKISDEREMYRKWWLDEHHELTALKELLEKKKEPVAPPTDPTIKPNTLVMSNVASSEKIVKEAV